MTPKSLSTLLSVALLSASCSLLQAQQPTAPPPPAADSSGPPPAPITRPTPRSPRGPIPMERGDRGSGRDEGPRTRMAPHGMWWKNPRTIQELSLTDDQQKKMDEIFQKSRLQLIDLKANVEKQEVILEPMLDANPPDTNKVLAQIDHVAQARAELEKANARMLLGIRAVLTADQWTKLHSSEHDGSMMHKGDGRMGGPGRMGGGPGMMGRDTTEGPGAPRFTTPDTLPDPPAPTDQ